MTRFSTGGRFVFYRATGREATLRLCETITLISVIFPLHSATTILEAIEGAEAIGGRPGFCLVWTRNSRAGASPFFSVPRPNRIGLAYRRSWVRRQIA